PPIPPQQARPRAGLRVSVDAGTTRKLELREKRRHACRRGRRAGHRKTNAMGKTTARKPAPDRPARRVPPEAAMSGDASPAEAGKPVLLSGGNPQIAKGYGDAPVQAYIAAMPGWKRDAGRRLDEIVARTVPDVRKAVKWN